MGGVGKTQVAIQYAHRRNSDYDVVWWVASAQPALIPRQLAVLAERLGVGSATDVAESVASVTSYLRERTRWLIVFDGAEDPAMLQSLLPSGQGSVLITTRKGGFGAISRVLDVDVMFRSEAVELLMRRLPGATVEDAESVAATLGDLPLAIEQASAYLERTQLPVEDYLAAVRTRTEAMLQRGEVARHDHTLATLWRISMEKIRSYRPGALQLLTLIAYLSAEEPVPLDLFTSCPTILPSPLGEEALDPIDFAETVGALVDYSLIRRSGGSIASHRLVQAATRRYLAETAQAPTGSDQHSTLDMVLRLLDAAMPEKIWNAPHNWPRWQALLPHVIAALDRYRSDVNDTNVAARLLESAGSYVHASGQPPTMASELFERAIVSSGVTSAPDNPETTAIRDKLAISLRDQGDYGRAEQLCREVLAEREGIVGPDHSLTMATRNALAGILTYRGQYESAERLYREVLTYQESAVGIDHPDTTGTRNDLSTVLFLRGEFVAAEQFLRQVVAVWETARGRDHVATLNARHNLGLVLKALGELTEAEQLLRSVLAAREAEQGFRHPSTLATRGYLASVLLDKGELAAAERLYGQLVVDRERLLGIDHPDTLSARNQLAVVLRCRGQLPAAERLLRSVLADRKRVLGAYHPYTLTTEYALARVMQDRGRLTTAARSYRRILADQERILGNDHPDTIATRRTLADAMKERDRRSP